MEAERPAWFERCGMIPVEQGSVSVDGRPVSAWSRKSLARIVGVVGQQEETVFPLRVREAVMLGRYAHLAPLDSPRPVDQAAVTAALERCDIVELADRSVDT